MWALAELILKLAHQGRFSRPHFSVDVHVGVICQLFEYIAHAFALLNYLEVTFLVSKVD